MIDGLIITADKAIFDEININFASNLSYFEHAPSVTSAKNLIELDSFDYVVLVEQNFEEISQMADELNQIEVFANTPVMCCTKEISIDQRKYLWQKGVKDIIRFPASREELQIRLERFFNDFSEYDTDEQTYGMQGKLQDYNLLDIVQTLEQNKKTGILTLYHGRDEGKIWFNQGKICDASYRKFENLPAIFKLATWLEGDFTITFVDEVYEDKILVDNKQILLDAIQYIDRRNKLLGTLPDSEEILLISPETDMELVADQDLPQLKFFQGGQTISAYLFAFDEDELMLLEKIKTFLDENLLMTREQFNSHMTEQEREIADAGIKNVFKRLFKGSALIKDKDKQKPSAKAEKEKDPTGIFFPYQDKKYEAQFNPEVIELGKFIDSIKRI